MAVTGGEEAAARHDLDPVGAALMMVAHGGGNLHWTITTERGSRSGSKGSLGSRVLVGSC